ncbi:MULTISPECIES: LuxR C-terminal-related transcriptional regulator [Streptacidiphilus]|uniref:LuxR C-terminal-related transcriptional regulator n=1 Tax=Streptacidiphilus cavernicola TaxID=3342716 RepID=A0ABV6UID9_9ACTN|nr:LuxR C-terminal-related transcriptional regulator [Streptacidiphilus jeojiense]
MRRRGCAGWERGSSLLLEDPAWENSAELVGRPAELHCLSELVRRMSTGRGGVLEITGEPGIGKTSLLGQLAQQAVAAGARVLRVHAVHGTTEHGQAVGELLAALEGRRPAASHTGPPVEPDLRSLLGSWAADQGGVLLLDDVHLCDEQSARAVAQLLRRPPSGPFAMALAHRPRQTGALLTDALERGAETGDVIRLTPSPLDTQATSTLLGLWRARTNTPFPGTAPRNDLPAARRPSWEPMNQGAYAEQLHAASGGNPRLLQILAAARWDPDEWPLSAGPDRDGLRRAAAPLLTEFTALSTVAATTAEVAAVLGDPFLPAEVAAISGLGVERTLGAFTELSAADLIRPLPWGGRYAFRHPVLGHVVLEHASPSLRLSAHSAALELLTARRAPAVQRARHAEYLVGSGSVPALQGLIEGAAEATAQAPATAARWLGLALEHLPTGTGISATRAVLVLDCCRALTAVGHLREARSLAHELLRHRSDLPDDLAVRAYAVCGEVERLLGRYQEADAVVHAGLDLLPRPLPVPLPGPAAELITTHGRVQMFRDAYAQARDLVREAAQAASGADPMAPYLRALAAFGDTQLGLLPEAAPEITECARLVDALPDATAASMPEVLAMLGCSELFHERIHDAYRHLERGLDATSGGSRRYLRINQLVALCHLDQLTGRLDALGRRAREAELLARMIGADEGAGIALTLRATGLLWTRPCRDTGRVIEIAEEGHALAHAVRGLRANVTVGLLAYVQFYGGHPADCLRTLAEAGGPRLRGLLPPWRASLLALASTAALRCGDIDAARSWAVAAEATATQLGLPLQQQHVRRAQAELHAAVGDHDAAAELFHQAAEAFRRAGLPVEHALTLLAGARSAHTAGGRSRALEWLDSAAKVSRGCGARRILEEVARARAELTPPHPADGSVVTLSNLSTNPAVALLSNREREIARLAVMGRSTKEIAEQLFLSARTVDTHLGNIYRKLGIRSRAALLHALSSGVANIP